MICIFNLFISHTWFYIESRKWLRPLQDRCIYCRCWSMWHWLVIALILRGWRGALGLSRLRQVPHYWVIWCLHHLCGARFDCWSRFTEDEFSSSFRFRGRQLASIYFWSPHHCSGSFCTVTLFSLSHISSAWLRRLLGELLQLRHVE